MADIMTEQTQEFTIVDEEDVLARFERFKSRVNERFHAQYERMRVARGFLSGETQWDEGDNRYISEKRNRLTVNVVANNVASTANSYDEYPFQWYTGEWE